MPIFFKIAAAKPIIGAGKEKTNAKKKKNFCRASIAAHRSLSGYDLPVITIEDAIAQDRLDVFTKCPREELEALLKTIASERKDAIILYMADKLR